MQQWRSGRNGDSFHLRFPSSAISMQVIIPGDVIQWDVLHKQQWSALPFSPERSKPPLNIWRWHSFMLQILIEISLSNIKRFSWLIPNSRSSWKGSWENPFYKIFVCSNSSAQWDSLMSVRFLLCSVRFTYECRIFIVYWGLLWKWK